MFADRTNWTLTQNKISLLLEQLRQADKEILDLTASNPTNCNLAYPQDQILAALSDSRNLTYSPSAPGLLSAREAVCAYYAKKGIIVEPKKVFLTASTSEAYSFLFRLLANAGDTVLFPRPSYPLFEFLMNLNDLVCRYYPLRYDDGWSVDLEKFQEAAASGAKAVILVNPNNPTGSFIKPAELDSINKVCQDQNIPVICDEVFFDYAFDGQKSYCSLTQNENTLSFVLGGLSKTLGLPQMKISWIIVNGPQQLVDEAIGRLEVIADTYLSVNTPAQHALNEWLNLQPVIQKGILQRMRQNQAFIQARLSAFDSCQCLSAEGGWYTVLKLPDGREEEPFVLELLEKDQVLVHPGYFFDFFAEPYIILSLLPEETVFQEGFDRILARI